MVDERGRREPMIANERPVAVSSPSQVSLPAVGSTFAALHRVTSNPGQLLLLLGSLVCLLLFSLLFRDGFRHFYYVWTTDENYSHGFLVPFLSAYFAVHVLRSGPVAIRHGVLLGTFLLVIALSGQLLTIPLPIPFVGDLALLVALTGVCALLLGSEALRRYWFAFFFLVFMVQLPVALYSQIASPLQLLASTVASSIMNTTGVPVLCEGNRMTLPGGVQMFVAEACSGMRLMTGFLALTTAVAYLTTRPHWYRAAVILSALPIALTANVARIVLTGYTMHFIDPQYASGAYHTLEGVLMMGFGLLLLNSLCLLLNRFCSQQAALPQRAQQRVLSRRSHIESRPSTTCALLTSSARWGSGSLRESLVPLRTPKELP
jgi:exosortase